MSRRPEFYKGLTISVPESELRLSSDVMTRERFDQLDLAYEEFLIEVSQLLPQDERDDTLKRFTSEHLDARFKKGDRQFCAGGSTADLGQEPLWALQEDYRLGNTNTCAERSLLDEADQQKKIIVNMTVYRGERLEVGPDGSIQTLQERGGARGREKAVMRHMVTPCAYCREGYCHHNPAGMVIMPRGILKPNEKAKTMKVPVFLLYPQEDLFQDKDPLLEKLQSGNPGLARAREMQREFFKKIIKDSPPTDADRSMYTEAYKELASQPVSDKPYMLIRARTITNKIVETSGNVPLANGDFNYLEYRRNPVQARFVTKLLEEPHFPPSEEKRPGSSHSLNVFLELYRAPGSKEIKLMLPNADTRQRIIERFQRSYILQQFEGELVKVPTVLFYPSRYKRMDKPERP